MYGEHNFSIQPTENQTFLVVSDSIKFGKNAVTFESYDRDTCVEYISKQRPPQEWGAYIIPDMKPLYTHEKPLAPIEHFETVSQALERFNELRNEEYNEDTSINPNDDIYEEYCFV